MVTKSHGVGFSEKNAYFTSDLSAKSLILRQKRDELLKEDTHVEQRVFFFYWGQEDLRLVCETGNWLMWFLGTLQWSETSSPVIISRVQCLQSSQPQEVSPQALYQVERGAD